HRFKVHNDGFAEHVDEARVGDAIELGQTGAAEFDARMKPPRLRQKTFGRIVADRSKSVLDQPGGVAAAAATNIRAGAGREEFSDGDLQIDRCWLGFPLGGESSSVPLVSGERFLIHGGNFSKSPVTLSEAAIGPKRTRRSPMIMSAFEGKADVTLSKPLRTACPCTTRRPARLYTLV